MKRLLLLTPEYPPVEGGVARYLETLVAALGPYAHTRLLVPLDLRPRVAHADVRMLPKAHWRKFGWIFSIRPLIEESSGAEVDAVVVSHLLPWGTVAALASLVTKKPYWVVVHGLDIALAEEVPWKAAIARWVLQRAQLLIANSEYTQARAKAVAPQTPSVVVYPSTARSISVPHPSAPSSRPYALAVGRMVSRKGFRTIPRMMSLVRQTIPDAQVVCIGDGPERYELIKDIHDLHMEDAVLVKTADDVALDAWYAHCRFFVLPVLSTEGDPEGFGIVFLEAAAFGKAVLTGCGGGIPEAVQDARTGLCIDPRDPNALATAFIRLWSHPEEADRLGQAGKRRVEERFRPEHTIQPLREALQKL